MTARQAIGSWCLFCLVAGLAIGWFGHTCEPCTYQSETAYTAQGHPLCVIVRQTKETP